MDPAHSSFDLSEHGDWLGDLARRIARSESDAEDLVQQTFLAALQAQLRDVRNPRSWLSATLRNAARQKYRAQLRREEHERFAAEPDPETISGGEEAASEPSELLEALCDAIQALREPYRSVVHLRYACGLVPSRIAERQGVPVGTVTTRLRRAHRMLRDRLERRGRSRGFAGIAVFWARLKRALDERLTVQAFGAVALLAAAGLMLESSPSRRTGRPVTRPLGVVASAPSEANPRESVNAVALAARRAPVASHGSAPPPDNSPLITVEGVVVDPHLRPLGGVRVRFEEGTTRILPGQPPSFAGEPSGARPPATTTLADGSFSLAVPAGSPGRAVAEDERFAAVVTAERLDQIARGSDVVLVSAPRRSIRGRVVDELGRPCPGTLVVFLPPRPLVHGSAAVVARPATYADEGGAFSLEAFDIEGARLNASHPRFGETRIAVEGSSVLELQLVAPRAGRELRGRVIDVAGRGVRALVAVNGRIRSTDAAGAFALDLPADEPLERVVAVGTGALPGQWIRSRSGGTRPPGEVTIRLGGRPGTISGRVLDEHGAPCAGIPVWVADPSPFGFENRPWFVEGLIQGGREVPVPEVTDHAGRFSIGGLLDRDYELRAVDRRTLRVAEAQARGGELDAAIVFDAPVPFAPWSGRVVAASGEAVEGARVVVGTPAIEVTLPWRRPPVRFDVDALSAWSGDGGHIVLPGFEPARAFLRVTGADVYPTEVPGLLRRSGELVVPLRAATRFDLVGAHPDDRLRAYDRHGLLVHPLRRWEGLDPHGRHANDFTAADASAGSFDLPETAALLVVSRGGETLHRQPLSLSPGEVNRVFIDLSTIAAP